jgi:hypothetical protein
MIRNIEFDQRPIGAGEMRALVVHADSPLRVAIKCFVEAPPPRGYRPCDACGVITLQSGAMHFINADKGAFKEEGGRLEITVSDRSGDTRTFNLEVQIKDIEPTVMPTASA